MLDEDNSTCGVDRAFAAAVVGFGSYFDGHAVDLVVILGDRYEMLAVAFAALNHGVPIAHIHGGETTEGAIDESIRHAITKMSTLHFTSCEDYRLRVMQLGENPDYVFNVGALGVENIRTQKLMDRCELEEDIGFSFAPHSALVTYHPTTLSGDGALEEIRALLDALAEVGDLHVLFTRANADVGGQVINCAIEEFAATREGDLVVASLGLVRYLSALAAVDVVVGNSSSGLLET
ncbi:MAG: UDP-N-acetylglucosamine 2-epimerase, partial [Alistipes sp.]